MLVLLGYVGENFVNVFRDSGCSGVVVKCEFVKDSELIGKNLEMCVDRWYSLLSWRSFDRYRYFFLYRESKCIMYERISIWFYYRKCIRS